MLGQEYILSKYKKHTKLGLTLIPIVVIVDVTVPFIIMCPGFVGITTFKMWIGIFYKEVLLRLPFTCVVPTMFVTLAWNV